MFLQRGYMRSEVVNFAEVYARTRRDTQCARRRQATTGQKDNIYLLACQACCTLLASISQFLYVWQNLLIPLAILKLVEYSGQIEVLFEVLDSFLALRVGSGLGLSGIDIVAPH